MDTELLPPEEEQKQSEVDPQELQRQFDMPSPQRNAGQDGPSRTKQAAGFLKKNKKWFIGGGAGLGLLVPIFMFFFWLMLFKNVHIKNLYVTYRWAQFNRGLNKSLGSALKNAEADSAARPSGDASTTVDPTSSPDEIMRNANADEINTKLIKPDDPASLVQDASETAKSVEGSSQAVLDEFGSGRALPPDVSAGGTDEEIAKSPREKASANVEEELSKPGKELEGKAPGGLDDGVKNADDLEAKGATPQEAASTAADGVIGGANALRIATGAGVAATFYCLFRDIYVSLKETVNKVVLSGAVNVAQEVNKTGSAQQLNKANLDQAGALADKFDNSDSSFTESCGYTRATQSSNTACEEINPQFTINWIARAAGPAGVAVKTTDAIFDLPKPVAILVNPVCSAVTSTAGQLTLVGLNIAGFVLSDGGWAAAGKAIATGVVAGAGTAGGKALIAHAILLYGGKLYKNLGPHDMGNLVDMGNLATASGTCRKMYCVPATQAQIAELDKQYRTERIAANSRRSILSKFFDTSSSDSVIVRAALNTPTTPKAIIGRMRSVFASIFSPVKLSGALGSTALAMTTAPVYAATGDGADMYGLEKADYVAPSLLYNFDYTVVNKWAKNKSFDEQKYKDIDSCVNSDKGYTAAVEGKNCDPGKDTELQMYMQYKYQQASTYLAAIAHNNQTNITSTTTPGGSNTAGPVFMLGDSITEGLDIVGIAKTFEDKGYSPVNIDASRSRGFTVKGVDNAKTSAFEALDDPTNISNIKKASYVFVGLGTNPLGNINTTTYGDQIGQTIDKIRAINSSASIYWLNVISPAISQAPARNNTLNQQAAAKNFTVIDATSLKLNFADKVHPDVPSYNTLASFIVSKMTAGSAPSGDAKALAQQLLDSPQVSFTTTQAEDALKAIASGGKARVPCLRNDGGGTYISSSLLNALVKVTGKYSIGIGYLTNGCHDDKSAHYSGRAVDINQVNGQRVTGSEKISWDFLTELSNFLPDGSGYGQAGCGVSDTTVRLAHKINIFDDTCNHIHVQVPK